MDKKIVTEWTKLSEKDKSLIRRAYIKQNGALPYHPDSEYTELTKKELQTYHAEGLRVARKEKISGYIAGATTLLIIAIVGYLWLFNSSFFLNEYYQSDSAGSKKDSFLIALPLKPTVSRNSMTDSIRINGGIDSSAEYSYNDQSFNQQYYVLVYKYDKSITDFSTYDKSKLNNTINNDLTFRASLVSGEKIASNNPTIFKNIGARKAEIQCGNVTCYELEFPDIQDNYMFVIMTQNMDSGSFNTFADSFQFAR